MFCQDTADVIIAGLAEGKSLRAVCRQDGMPSASTVLRWLKEDEKFAEQYADARTRSYELLADEILDISDETEGDTIKDKDGNERANAEWISRSKLRVDSRKWLLAKMLPKVYGDKLDLTVNDKREAKDLSNDDLLSIASRGSQGAAEAPSGTDEPRQVH